MNAQGASLSVGAEKLGLWERRAFEKQLINVLPSLRAMARILTRNTSAADDLVQDTLVRALRACDQFDPSTSMKSWTFRILHNCHINSFRRKRPVDFVDEIEDWVQVPPSQEDSVELKDVLRALDTLAPSHREAILLVRAGGVSYEDAAAIMCCRIGTIKSRLNRAETALRAALGEEYAAGGASRTVGAPTAASTFMGNRNTG